MFKVASVINHSGLKSELENLAITFTVDPCPDNILRAENLLSFGREVGEIKPINTVILIRELESLRKGIMAVPVIEDMDISTRFVRQIPNMATSSSPSVIPAQTEIQAGHKNNPAINTSVPAKKIRSNGSGRKPIFDPAKIIQYVAEHDMAKLRDLEIAFSEMSGRTIRRTIENLVKQGKIERVGTPGPKSFYRVKAFTSATQPTAVETGSTIPTPDDIPQLYYDESPNSSPSLPPVIAL
ncbi:MAG: DeoR family transcriptional regulator [Parcubacteria group bacterium]